MAAVAVALLAGVKVAAAQRASPYLPDINEHYTLRRLPTSNNPLPLTVLQVTDNVIELKRANAWSPGATYVQALRRQAGAVRITNGTANLLSVEAGSVFLAPVTVGGQSFDVVIDSGSSDPWLVTPDFACIDVYDGSSQTQDACDFGSTYNSNSSSTYSQLPNQHFDISYADGESLTGSMGYESFTMAGITVPHQETLTSAYAGSNPNGYNNEQALMYNPLFVNMYATRGVPPIFTLAIDRDNDNGGVLALGGIPNVPYSPGFASTPIIPFGVNTTSGADVYEFYTVEVDGFAFSSNQNVQFNMNTTSTNPRKKSLVASGTHAIVDSGTSVIYADNDTLAGPIAAAFTPPGFWNDEYRVWQVPCNAKAPVFGVAISGKIFYVNGVDMILQSSQTDCISGVQPSGTEQTILGDVWMKNVLCVFDLGAEMMRFAAREFYGLTAQSRPVRT
ncbi:hypothetical protein LTR53_002018 [Teratosphaeriaceae sp. CCFEE 6253]|nr:hypothetical protein LTR53_002018 [Teratosphaeriaceae sp. CCFEE 6253]